MSTQGAAIRLFHAVIAPPTVPVLTEDALALIHEQTVRHGFVFTPLAAAVVSESPVILSSVAEAIGISGDKINSAFHKSWKIVEETPEWELRLQQIVHYITTYGFEALGMYSEQAVYVPQEVLEIPALGEGLKLLVVDALTKEQLLERALRLAAGVALKEQTLLDLFSIISTSAVPVTSIGNRELRSKLYEHWGLVPQEPVEYLRFLVQKLTGQALLIKSGALLRKISEASEEARANLPGLLSKAPKDLASIFLRYKPIFLAIKKISPDRSFFNRLRRQAVTMHRPLPEDPLNAVTARVSKGLIYRRDLNAALKKANIFRKIRLAYALQFRTNIEADSIVYRVRNGKAWATEFSFSKPHEAGEALELVLASIARDLSHLDGKAVYIPSHVSYALPSTEKAYTGHMPSGSYIEVPEDMIVGIHWYNVDGHRIDLDLSTMSASGKVGWDSNYRSSSGDVLFSGDLTSAPLPNGAAELFYIKEGSTEPKIMLVNYFNHSDIPVEAKIVVGHDQPTASKFTRSYMLDPNKVLAVAPVTITQRQTVLGLIVEVDGKQRFYFAQSNIGDSITSYGKDYITHARDFYTASMLNRISLAEVLLMAGATVHTVKPEGEEFIDLSPESLTRSTIVELLQK